MKRLRAVDSAKEPEAAGKKSTTGGLKAECQTKYRQVRDQALEFLISCNALIAEGEARGLRATNDELKQRFDGVRQAEFSSDRAAVRDRELTGETIADQLFRALTKVYTKKLEQHFLTAPGLDSTQRNQALVRWTEGFPKRWAAKTSCASGYVVPNCRQYRGTQAPAIVI